MKIGYCRISTKNQSFHLQEDALKAEGCERLFKDIVSGVKSSRPGLDDMLAQLRPGDVIVVYKLDRLGRSLKHLVELINELSGVRLENGKYPTLSSYNSKTMLATSVA